MSDCGPNPTDNLSLRIGAIFVVLVTSLVGTLFPVLAKRVPSLRRRTHPAFFEFAKFFGSGVILSTGFVHLLQPGNLELTNTEEFGGCINNSWNDYPYAFGICIVALFGMFVMHIVTLRIGTARLAKLAAVQESNVQVVATVEGDDVKPPKDSKPESDRTDSPVEFWNEETAFHDASEGNSPSQQLLSVAILEFGIIFHSVIIGLTLSVTSPDQFNILFIVIVFHQAFEGLGLGARLAFLQLPPSYNWVPIAGAFLYSAVTPIGQAIGLAARETIAIGSADATIAAGVLDSISGGILIYTSTVALMGQEFIFNKYYHTCTAWRLWFSLGSFAAGAGIMSVLGKWA